MAATVRITLSDTAWTEITNGAKDVALSIQGGWWVITTSSTPPTFTLGEGHYVNSKELTTLRTAAGEYLWAMGRGLAYATVGDVA